jgi:CheY-like chemotaxis protein
VLPKLASKHPVRVDERASFAPSERKPRVLIVEDNSWIALMMAEEVTELACVVVGPARTVSEALALAHSQLLDAALVDIELGDETAFMVAQVLADRHIPFTFITGFSKIPEAPFDNVPVLAKPFGTAALRRALSDMLGQRA